ncbi:ATP-binding protein [Shimia marina]|uniref:histidine kinase n=1 Tax=Shimia marina TaxID=321267 RepID=A0A0N7LRL3_9RHOB|nr:ATP-binding protein [Shimia marina]CUH51140.1 Autoinducer 2 sensor kinase/phosphatase LuxQ [Shimia marina]SFD57086.1 Hpt sensor hybrid histidine kinase [Shimia marina]
MAELRITRKYLRLRSGIALGIVLLASITAMSVAFIGRENVATRTENTSSIDMVLLSLSELSLAFYELKETEGNRRVVSSRGQVRRAAHSAQVALDRISTPDALIGFAPDAQRILTRETFNPLWELEEILFMAEVVVDPRNSDLNIERAASLAADLSVRLLPIFNRIRQVEMDAGEQAADRQLLYGVGALLITLLGGGVAARFVFLPMERYVIGAQSEIHRSRKAAEAASESKSMFLATMSHEIRTPLNGVLGLADVLAETKLDDEQERMVSMISTSGQSLLQLINDVLDLAKFEAGKMVLEYKDFNLQEMCTEVAELFSGQAKKRAVTLEVLPQQATSDWHVHGAPNAVRQVLTNLVGNAVKFTENGTVSIYLENVEDRAGARRLVRLSVKDQGIGIAPEALGRIFGQFEQADASTTTQFGGTGLGLAIVKRLTEAMQGRVHVDSMQNEGSVFSITFPVETAKSAPERPLNLRPCHFEKRVLVADDNRVNQLVAQKLLQNLGCEVKTVSNGVEAVAEARSWGPDLILMDVRMPKMDGVQATRAIRDEPDCADTAGLPIIGLSANALSEYEGHCVAAGMNGYLQKPINRKALVRELLRHWPEDTQDDEQVRRCV